MLRLSLGVIVGLLVAGSALPAQSGSGEAASKTRAIAASFSKFKNVSKTRHGVTRAKYKKVESEPVIKSNPAEYSGVYEVQDLDFALNLTVDSRGVVTGSGYEPLAGSVKRAFTLRDGRIEGALLTATKVYADGGTERLEGAFMNRTASDSPNDRGETVFGFGALGKPIEVSGSTIDKFFYARTR